MRSIECDARYGSFCDPAVGRQRLPATTLRCGEGGGGRAAVYECSRPRSNFNSAALGSSVEKPKSIYNCSTVPLST